MAAAARALFDRVIVGQPPAVKVVGLVHGEQAKERAATSAWKIAKSSVALTTAPATPC